MAAICPPTPYSLDRHRFGSESQRPHSTTDRSGLLFLWFLASWSNSSTQLQKVCPCSSSPANCIKRNMVFAVLEFCSFRVKNDFHRDSISSTKMPSQSDLFCAATRTQRKTRQQRAAKPAAQQCVGVMCMLECIAA